MIDAESRQKIVAPSVSRQFPVVLIGFNRPDLTRQVLDSIRPAQPETLLVCIDGPRTDRPEDPERIEAVAKVFEEIDWPCALEIHRQSKNLGCRHNPAYAITWMLDRFGAGVIIEDDCVASPSFLPFCWELLAKYEHDSRIGMISGISSDVTLTQGASYGFTQYCYISAWATWRDRWADLDLEMGDAPEIKRHGLLEAIFPSEGVSRFWTQCMERVYTGDPRAITSWDFQWSLLNFLNHRICVVPAVNLICNIGSGPDATNSLPTDWFLHMEAKTLEFPLKHPKYMVVDSRADRIAERKRFSLPPLIVRIGRRAFREIKARRLRTRGRHP